MSDQPQAENDAFCPCGLVDDLGDGTCGNCGLRIMTEGDETLACPPAERACAPCSCDKDDEPHCTCSDAHYPPGGGES